MTAPATQQPARDRPPGACLSWRTSGICLLLFVPKRGGIAPLLHSIRRRRCAACTASSSFLPMIVDIFDGYVLRRQAFGTDGCRCRIRPESALGARARNASSVGPGEKGRNLRRRP